MARAKTKEEISALLARLNFREIGSQYWWDNTQGNVVVVKASATRPTGLDIAMCRAGAAAASAVGACIEPARRQLYRFRNTRPYVALKRFYLRRLF